MEQYISKSALVAEIERRLKALNKDRDFNYLQIKELEALLPFLDTLEVKEKPVSEDLDEASVNYAATGKFLPNGKEMIDFQLEKAFKAGAKWQKEQMIEKACEWLKEHKEYPFIGCEDPCLSGYLTDEFIEDFKKAMEDKLWK